MKTERDQDQKTTDSVESLHLTRWEGATSRIRSEVKYFLKRSKVINPASYNALPRFESQELVLGKLLGSGGFSDAFEVTALDLSQRTQHANDENVEGEFDDEICPCQQMQHRCQQNVRGRSPYVVKMIQPKLLQRLNRFKNAAVDLIVEAHMLSSLDHPHILNIRGWSLQESFIDRRHDNFFFILDRLDGTLSTRIAEWRKQMRVLKETPTMLEKVLKHQHCIRHQHAAEDCMDKKECIQDLLFSGRLAVIRDLSSALTYLHGKGVIYRDLKPDNIGFDLQGRVKLFDFGLARELPDASKVVKRTSLDSSTRLPIPLGDDNEIVYDMSQRIGTVRYMAPEVHRCHPYNLKADVYSIALVAWQVMALKKPFETYTKSDHKLFVVHQGERPSLTNVMWPIGVKTLISTAWASDIAVRPSMKEFHEKITREIEALQNECKYDGECRV